MAVFGLKYWAELSSKYQGIPWRCEIAQRGYTGEAEEMTFSGTSPVKVTWERRGDDFYAPVKASEASINIVCKDNFHYLGLFTSDPREYRMSLFRNGTLFWRGFIVADLYSERFASPPYDVTIKAVDGFNILSNIDFKDILGMGTTGRKSLNELLTTCIDVLELDMDICQWLDLIPEGVGDTTTPLRYVYLNLDRLFYVYEEPTYRDILELCIAPFGAQIFQSGGCIHIRRVVSLYNEYRPWQYDGLVKDRRTLTRFSSKGEQRITGQGDIRIVSTDTTRLLQNDLWEDGFYMIGENTTLDIVPAILNIDVSVRNKALDNLCSRLGFIVPDMWSDTDSALSFGDDGSVTLTGDSNHLNTTIITTGCSVQQCNFNICWEFMLKAGYSNYTSVSGSGSSSSQRNNTHTVTLGFGVKIVSTDGQTTYWLDSDGGWNTEETDLSATATTGTDENFKVDIGGIPCDGTWYFYIIQTLIGSTTSSGRNYYRVYERMTFYDMKMTIDAGDLYDQGLVYSTLVNPANNVNLDIELPVSDIPAIPNDILLYSLYFVKQNDVPTRLWRTRESEDYATLVTHMAIACLRMRQLPAKRLNGEIFTSLHLDLNSVILDEKYLNAGFYVNSLEVDGLGDSYNTELVELPRLINPDIPEEGDDCVTVYLLDTAQRHIVQSIRCLDFILLCTDKKEIYRFDTVTRSALLLYSSQNTFDLFEAAGGFVRVEDGVAYYCDCRGVVRKQLTLPDSYAGFITVRDGYFWMLTHFARTSVAGSLKYMGLSRPEVKTTYVRTTGSSRGQELVNMYGTYESAVVSKNQIVINTSQSVYMYDCRYHNAPNVMEVKEYSVCYAVTDDYLALDDAAADAVKLYKRDSLTTYSEVRNINEYCDHCAISQTKVCCVWDSTNIFDLANGTSAQLINQAAGYSLICGVFFIYGDLYIVREQGIYKYCP